MKNKFRKTITSIENKFEQLVRSREYDYKPIPAAYEKVPGVYLFFENEKPLYVGRTNNLRKRLNNHTQKLHNKASLAFLMAREKTGRHKASYKQNDSRKDLLRIPSFKKAFDEALARICKMKVKVIEERDPISQSLLEIYTAFILQTKYNNFDNH